MRHDDRDSSVEFLVSEPGGGTDEDLRAPDGFPRARRARLPLLVAAGIALVALVVGHLATKHSSTPSAAPAGVTPTPSSTPTRTPAPAPEVACPHHVACVIVSFTPARVAGAIRERLPRVTALRTLTTEDPDAVRKPLLTRRITGRVGEARLRIDLRAARPNDQLGWNASETPARTLVTVRDHVGGRLVTLRVVGTPGYEPDISATRALAADRRLATSVRM